jgi:hypothetical protein
MFKRSGYVRGLAALKSRSVDEKLNVPFRRARVEDVQRRVDDVGAELQVVIAAFARQEPREGLIQLIRRIHAAVRARAEAVGMRLISRLGPSFAWSPMSK